MGEQLGDRPLQGKVALVAGATRGAGRAIAVELCRAGAFVYATGRSSRVSGPSDMDRPETIEETGELMLATGGDGSALRVDHLDVDAVADLVARIEAERGRLDILVNDIFGGHNYMQWDKKLWEHDLTGGLYMLRMGVHTHLITCAKALPLILRTGNGLVIEMTDGTAEYNRAFRRNVGFYYDLVKANVGRIALALAAELEDETCTAVAVTPGWMRSEQMLEGFGVTDRPAHLTPERRAQNVRGGGESLRGVLRRGDTPPARHSHGALPRNASGVSALGRHQMARRAAWRRRGDRVALPAAPRLAGKFAVSSSRIKTAP